MTNRKTKTSPGNPTPKSKSRKAQAHGDGTGSGADVCGVRVDALPDSELGALLEAVTEETGRRLAPVVAEALEEGAELVAETLAEVGDVGGTLPADERAARLDIEIANVEAQIVTLELRRDALVEEREKLLEADADSRQGRLLERP